MDFLVATWRTYAIRFFATECYHMSSSSFLNFYADHYNTLPMLLCPSCNVNPYRFMSYVISKKYFILHIQLYSVLISDLQTYSTLKLNDDHTYSSTCKNALLLKIWIDRSPNIRERNKLKIKYSIFNLQFNRIRIELNWIQRYSWESTYPLQVRPHSSCQLSTFSSIRNRAHSVDMVIIRSYVVAVAFLILSIASSQGNGELIGGGRTSPCSAYILDHQRSAPDLSHEPILFSICQSSLRILMWETKSSERQISPKVNTISSDIMLYRNICLDASHSSLIYTKSIRQIEGRRSIQNLTSRRWKLRQLRPPPRWMVNQMMPTKHAAEWKPRSQRKHQIASPIKQKSPSAVQMNLFLYWKQSFRLS